MSEPNPPYSPLLERIMSQRGYRIVGYDDVEALAHEASVVMLFFAGDHARLGESNDVAVVLPELDDALQGHVTPLIVARDDERALQRRFHFSAYPALVFLTGGAYLGVIEGIRDWVDYMREVPEILLREPTMPPPFKMPAGCDS